MALPMPEKKLPTCPRKLVDEPLDVGALDGVLVAVGPDLLPPEDMLAGNIGVEFAVIAGCVCGGRFRERA